MTVYNKWQSGNERAESREPVVRKEFTDETSMDTTSVLDTTQAGARRSWRGRCRENAIDDEGRAFIDARLKALEHHLFTSV